MVSSKRHPSEPDWDELFPRIYALERRLGAPPLVLPGEGGSTVTVTEGPGIDIVDTRVGIGADTILVRAGSGSPAAEQPLTEAGLTAALASCAAGDVCELPACDLSVAGIISVPESVTLKGISCESSILRGQVALGVGASVDNLKVAVTGSTATAMHVISGPVTNSTVAYVNNCVVVCSSPGTYWLPAAAIRVYAGGGVVRARNSWLQGLGLDLEVT